MNSIDHERASMAGSEQGTRPTSKGFYGLGDGSNPYAKYASSDDGDSLDDGINMDDRLENGDSQDPDQMPPEDFVLREFYDYMEVMSPMSDPETQALQRTSLVEKWSLVYNQQCRSPIFPLRHYVSSLRRHNDSRRRTFSWSRGSTDKDGVSKLAHLLRKLKADMKLSTLSFVEEFSDNANDGVKMLLKVLAEIQSDKNSASTSRKQKNDEYKRAVAEEYDCLLCLKFSQRSRVGVLRFLELDGAVDAIVSVIYGDNIKSLAVALDILNNLCNASGGPDLVLKALADYSMKHGEFLRFKPLVAKLKTNSMDQEIYTLSFMSLITHLRAHVTDAEGIVTMQYELREAGFDLSDINKMAQSDSVFGREVQKEIEIWQKGYIRVNEYAEEISSLDKRNRILREEIDHLQTQIKESDNRLDAVNKENTNLQKRSQDYHSRASELIETLEKIKSTNNGSPESMKDDVSSALKPLDPQMDRFATFRRSLKKSASSSPDDALSLSSFDSSASIPDAPPPPAPMPPKLHANNKNNNLPVLHWTPLYNVMGTVFQNVDNKILKEGDFSEFEEKFKVADKSPVVLTRKMSDENAKISIVDANRAKNLLITLRKIGGTPDEICHAIDTCDSKGLSGEDAELLRKFIPTREEANQMLQHQNDFNHLGEAEQFMFKMARIERLDSKMAVLVSKGSMMQQMNQLKPKIDNINDSVLSVKRNKKLQKILEIVLIFGNYMNSGKKGYAMGFKLESLSKLNTIKGKDNLSFMQFLVGFLQRRFPSTVDFYKDLTISSDSFQGTQEELQDIRKNLDLIRHETTIQTTNQELQKFSEVATKEMADVGDHFRRMERGYKEVCQMYGESYKDSDGSDILVHINEFAENFKKAQQELNHEGDGLTTPLERSRPTTPTISRSPGIGGIAAMLQQSEKFNQRAELLKKELDGSSEGGSQVSDPKGTLRKKSRAAPQPPAVVSPAENRASVTSPREVIIITKPDTPKRVDAAISGTSKMTSNQDSPAKASLSPLTSSAAKAMSSAASSSPKEIIIIEKPVVAERSEVTSFGASKSLLNQDNPSKPTPQPSAKTSPASNTVSNFGSSSPKEIVIIEKPSPPKRSDGTTSGTSNLSVNQTSFKASPQPPAKASPAGNTSNVSSSSPKEIIIIEKPNRDSPSKMAPQPPAKKSPEGHTVSSATSPKEVIIIKRPENPLPKSAVENDMSQPTMTPTGRKSYTSSPESGRTSPNDSVVQRAKLLFSNTESPSASPRTSPGANSRRPISTGERTSSPTQGQPNITPRKTPGTSNASSPEEPRTNLVRAHQLDSNVSPTAQLSAPGGRTVFPAKVPQQNRNSTVYKSPGTSVSSKEKAPEPPVNKVTPTFGKKLPSPNISNVLPNKTSPVPLKRTPERTSEVTSPVGTIPASSTPVDKESPSSEKVSPSGNVRGLVRSFLENQSAQERPSSPAYRRSSPPSMKGTSPSETSSPSQTSVPSPASKSTVGTSGQVIRNNSILFSARSPSSPVDKSSASSSAATTPTLPNKPKSPMTPASSTPSSAVSSRRTSIDENHNQDSKSVKEIKMGFERRRDPSLSTEISKTLSDFDKVLKEAGIAEETIDSYL